MNTGAQSRLLNIGRCMKIGQRQLEQTFSWSRSKFFSSNVFRQQGGRNSLEYSGITSLRPQRENDASKFLGAHSFSSSIQKRPYCGKQEGRRWIMKHHFKGMPTLQVINIITLRPYKKKPEILLQTNPCRILTWSQSPSLNWKRARSWSSDFKFISKLLRTKWKLLIMFDRLHSYLPSDRSSGLLIHTLGSTRSPLVSSFRWQCLDLRW